MTKRPSVFTIPNPLPLPLPLPSLSLSLTRIIISLNQNIHQDKTYFPADLCPNLTVLALSPTASLASFRGLREMSPSQSMNESIMKVSDT